jgi:LAO/AO transport system kinase
VPVLACAALRDEGIDDVLAAIDRVGRVRLAEGVLVRRRRRARYLLSRAAAELIRQRIRDGGSDTIDDLSDRLLSGELSPGEAARAVTIGV